MFKNFDKSNEVIDKNKFIYIPTLIIVIIILTAGLLILNYSKTILYEQLRSDALNFTHQTVKYIEQNRNTKDIVLENMEEQMSTTANLIFANSDPLSNGRLQKIADNFGMDKVSYYTPEGKVLYSASDENVNFKISPEDPVFAFMSSSENFYHGGIKKDVNSDYYYKFSYFKDPDGNILELGVIADKVYSDTDNNDYENIVLNISKNENIYYALITDQNLVSIADSDQKDIGIDWSSDVEYQAVLGGNPIAFEWYYDKIDANVLEVTVPLNINGNTEGLLGIGYSLDLVNSLIRMTMARIFFIILCCIFVLIYSQKKFIIEPILQLNTELTGIDLANCNQIPTPGGTPFKGIYGTVNTLLNSIDEHISKITAIKSRMEYDAYHDTLTGIRNRRALFEDLENILTDGSDGSDGSLCIFNVNNFQEINDNHGYVAGDDILRTIAQRVSSEKSEHSMLYRLFGDEFIVIFLNNEDHVEQECNNILNCVSQPIECGNTVLEISCCMGISPFISSEDGASELISKANAALYYVRNTFKKGFAIFMPFMQEELNRKSEINVILRKALKDEAFKLMYQPVIETQSGNIASFEALIRLRDHNISPFEFIKVAEEKGLIIDIGRWVIKTVVCQLSKWKKKGIAIRPIAINLSPKQIKDVDLLEFIQALLAEYGIESQFLQIEITEDLLVENSNESIVFLEKLKSAGFKISLDDFGSGYSSLTYLTFMPIDKVKLDKSLIDKYLNNDYCSIIKNIINIAHDLDLSVVAEGVELSEQCELLRTIDCDYIQGYFFSRPVDPDVAEKMM